MSQKIDSRLHLGKYNLGDLVETPGGLLVSAQSIEPLIKSEARKLAAEQGNNTPAFFSKHQLFQNMMYYGARAKPQGTPNFASLYEAANTSFIDRILVRARSNRYKQIWQKAVTGKSVGFRVVHEQYDDPKWRPTDDIIRRCKEMEDLIADPTPTEFTRFYPQGVVPHESGIKDMVARLVRAELIIDRKVLYRGRRRDGKGYAFFHWVPGQSVYPVHEALKRYEEKHRKPGDKTKMGFDQLVNRASASYGVDLTDKDYIQIDKVGEICGAFTADEISIHIANPSDEMDRFGFGESPLEISLDVTAMILDAWRYNQELFNSNYPEAFLEVVGEYDKLGLEAFKLQMAADSGRGNNKRLPVIASSGDQNQGADAMKFNVHKLRDNPKDMQFDNLFRMMCNIKCAAYGDHPSVINFIMDGGGGGSSLFGHSPKDEIESSKEHGFLPSLLDMASWLTRSIIKPTYSDLKLIIEGFDQGDEKQRQDIFLNKIKTYQTKNEARMADGSEPEGFWLPKEEYDKLAEDDPKRAQYDGNPYNYPADAPVATYITALASKAQMESMQQPGGDPDADPDDPNGDGGDPNQPPEDDGSPWAAAGDQSMPMQKSRPEVKYLKISIEG
jgi:hypothetical protein